MNIVTKQFSDLKLNYDLSQIAPLEDILFLDIETTGFSAASTSLYMIGCAYFDGITFTCKQFFAEKPVEEAEILKTFLDSVRKYKVLIHYNGNNFDIPYIQDKCKKYGYDCPLIKMVGIDLYKRVAPYKNFLKIPNCKQKTIEQYLGIDRKDVMSGAELINVYHEYVTLFDIDSLQKLLLHNSDDIQGMIEITPVLAYSELFNSPITVTKVSMDRYSDMNGKAKAELVMKLKLPVSLPQSITHMACDCYFKGEDNEGILKVPVYDGELKYFYSNYKDYYYLPEEDEALHKSVAGFVDKDHRTQAQANNCYTRVKSVFVPEWDTEFTPFFKTSYHSKELFIEINDERKKDREFFSKYASHVLGYISTMG
ncbi:MAG: ribonuclease H-like domain-containing protein [Lachnospiraceae bacterium]|nr:ribonuclease H-like domain-containing protein [Lachnospiraceae bacterium]